MSDKKLPADQKKEGQDTTIMPVPGLEERSSTAEGMTASPYEINPTHATSQHEAEDQYKQGYFKIKEKVDKKQKKDEGEEQGREEKDDEEDDDDDEEDDNDEEEEEEEEEDKSPDGTDIKKKKDDEGDSGGTSGAAVAVSFSACGDGNVTKGKAPSAEHRSKAAKEDKKAVLQRLHSDKKIFFPKKK